MGFSVMLWGAEKLVPAEYWCPYGTSNEHNKLRACFFFSSCLMIYDRYMLFAVTTIAPHVNATPVYVTDTTKGETANVR